MQQKNPWLLPDGIEEMLPKDTKLLEDLRSRLLEMFRCWGYELVITPLIDYLDSLLTGSGHDLDLQTFKLVDQLTGKTLGIRADMTPQVARIDAHKLKHHWPNRLCYCGTVLHTRSDQLEISRSPMQIGAELYGHAGQESDVEVICLMLEMLALSGILDVHLDLGHVGIYRALSRQAKLSVEDESDLFEILQRKARPELSELMATLNIDKKLKDMFLKLPELNGDWDSIHNARCCFEHADDEVKNALDDLEAIALKLKSRFPSLPISYDLTELRGFNYHTGIVFAAFIPSMGKEIARGGRYDNIGAFFGRKRSATGFSSDLKLLSTLGENSSKADEAQRIFAPFSEEDGLYDKIRELRALKYTVIQQLPGQSGGASELDCTSILEKHNQQWVIKPLSVLE